MPDVAYRLAESYLADELPRRWKHVQTVGARAESVATFIEEGELLVRASWLHDLGYASSFAICRFHPLDGARALDSLLEDQRLACLVAYHSAAAFEAAALGLIETMRAEFTDEESLTRDLLWYLDMTTGPDGATVTFDDRIAGVRDRYSQGHYVIRALDAGIAERRSAVARAESWLKESGLIAYV